MKRVLSTVTAISLLFPAVTLAQTEGDGDIDIIPEAEAETEAEDAAVAVAPMRPNDEDGTAPMWDGIAECAAILAATSPTATNLIDRRKMSQNSEIWLAAADDMASQEGSLELSDQDWATRVTDWAQRIGDVDGMRQQTAWMTYCADVANARGLDGTVFAAETQ